MIVLSVHLELQIRRANEDNSKIIFSYFSKKKKKKALKALEDNSKIIFFLFLKKKKKTQSAEGTGGLGIIRGNKVGKSE